MRNRRLMMLGFLLPALLLALACGGTAAPTLPPPATAAPTTTEPTSPPPATGTTSPGTDDGESIFTGPVGGCSVCHTIEGVAAGLVGPDLTHIGTDAGTRKPGLSAEDYIRESIREPEAFVAEGVEREIAGLMLAAVTANLTDG